MRIISGNSRGTKLETLEGITTRPTLDRVKESLFSIIQAHIQEAYVLDLFGGSGALALESLSRGAEFAVICDNSRKACNIIEENIEKTKQIDRVRLYNLDYKKCLNKLKEENITFDIIFIDPPYKSKLYEIVIQQIIELKLLKEDGIIILETDDKNIKTGQGVGVYDMREYGNVNLIFLNRKG